MRSLLRRYRGARVGFVGRATAALFMLLSMFVGASAQNVAVGGGVLFPTSDIAQLPSAISEKGWQALSNQASSGYYIAIRGRLGRELALVGGVAYNRFLERSSEFRDASGSSVELLTSQVIVPISVGIERRFGEGFLSPYASLEATASYFYRAFESMKGSTPVPIEFQSDGAMRFGGALGAGASLDLGVLRLDLGARYHLVNLVGPASTTESIMSYLQLGGIVYLAF